MVATVVVEGAPLTEVELPQAELVDIKLEAVQFMQEQTLILREVKEGLLVEAAAQRAEGPQILLSVDRVVLLVAAAALLIMLQFQLHLGLEAMDTALFIFILGCHNNEIR